jgi:hypothetical protein
MDKQRIKRKRNKVGNNDKARTMKESRRRRKYIKRKKNVEGNKVSEKDKLERKK